MMSSRRRSMSAAAAIVIGAGSGIRAQAPDLASEVLSLLSDRCFACHGPDAAERKADLRLDTESGVRTVLEPGDADASELVRRILATDDERMPPAESGLILSAAEIDLLRRWIDSGARWSRHWSFVAPEPIVQPADASPAWARNGIDRFVAARAAAHGVMQNPPAEPGALLRRVTLDLTALPPTPEELTAFRADPSDAAYERVVDRLLASKRYGERMAWPWLEASRYADTDGYQADPTRTAWPWRDWLVDALNDNMPFDAFTVAVLAGDLVPDGTAEQRLATGLLRNNAHNGEGGRIAEETRVENVFDRTEMVATVWMGLTFECARCHDHKYDPIAQRDYYRLFAFFDQTSETGRGRSGGVLPPTMRYLPDAAQQEFDAIDARRDSLATELVRDDPELDARERRWTEERATVLRRAAATFEPATFARWQQSPLYPPPGGDANALFGARFAPETEPVAVPWEPVDLREGATLALPSGAYAVYFRTTIAAPTPRRMKLSLGSDDTIQLWCNGELLLAKDVRRAAGPEQEQVDLRLASGANELLIKIGNTGGIGGIHVHRRTETPGDLPSSITRALLRPADARSPDERAALRRHFRRANVAGFRADELALERLEAARQKLLANALDVSVMDELEGARRRTTHVLERGSYRSRGATVTAGTPEFLPPLDPFADPDRLALARWLVSGSHPLTARVAVNRAWQTFFGRGLVATPEDFGRQGERPSHPQLLDWLATEFVRSGWDVKALHRRIVTSATYRQSAASSEAMLVADPANLWLLRSPRHRLPAWMLRDQALALSGRLLERIGGAPVRPYQPDDVWAEATFGKIRYRVGGADEVRRRTLYTFWRRIVGPTVLFDTPARQNCVVRRSVTNTPLHALTTLNETGFVEAARGFATRAWHAAATPAGRAAWLFRTATCREPTQAERDVLTRRAAACRAEFVAAPDRARALLGVGQLGRDVSVPTVDLAAWTIVASIVLNLDEVLTRP